MTAVNKKDQHLRSVKTLGISGNGDNHTITKILKLIDMADLTKETYRTNLARRIIWIVNRGE